jgi:hypothetical protein
MLRQIHAGVIGPGRLASWLQSGVIRGRRVPSAPDVRGEPALPRELPPGRAGWRSDRHPERKVRAAPPDQEIEPYELSLRDLGDADRQAWGARVLQQLDALTGGHVRETVFLAGRDYRDVLTPYLHARGISTRVHPRWRAITAAAFGAQATDPVSQSYENSAVSLTSE